ncbi:GGDEF domain-containing protein [Novosphingobium sp. JCM 18896]|nr:GGDEF domain-containing protein [Novosphingobium sp. JCM 18896]
MTGLYNRRYMEDVLERFIYMAERNGSSVAAIMIDLDHFKRLNDEFGHAMGDAVLREVAAAIAGAIRPSDVACRYGGEELIVLLPDCTLEEAAARAELLRARIEGLSEIHGARISASLGVASTAEIGARAAEIIATADDALYRAKQGGRNRVEVAIPRANSGWSPELAAAE